MDDLAASNLTRRRVVAIGLFCLFNVLAVMAAHWDIGQVISHAMGWQGSIRVGLTEGIVMASIFLVVGQVGCAAVWFSVSKRRLVSKIPIYLLVVLQLAGVLALQMIGHGPSGQVWIPAVMLLGVSVVFLALSMTAVRLSGTRICLVNTDQAAEGKSYGGISIAQGVFITAIVAVTLVTTSAGTPFNSTLHYVLISIQIGLVFGLLPFAGLMVAISVRRILVQVAVCIGLACIVCAFVAIGVKRWEAFQRFGPGMSLIALLPVLWLRIVKHLGYVIRCIEYKSKVEIEHPLAGEETAMEPSV